MAGTAAVVVNWNGGSHLERCIEALSRQTTPFDAVFVVDNGSEDGSLEGLSRQPKRLEIVRLGRNDGFARATNIGIQQAADADLVALVNPDAFLHPDWLEQLLLQAERQPGYSTFASLQLDAMEPTRIDGAGDVYSVTGLAWRRHHGATLARERLVEPEEVFGPCAAAALYRTTALAQVGPFDESFFCYFEDVDLAFRLRLAGHRCLFVPGAVAEHVGSASSGRRSDFTAYHGHRNLVWCWFKNMPAPLLAAYLPQHLMLNLLSMIWYHRRGQGRALRAAKRDALRGLPAVFRGRRRVQARRRISSLTLRAQMASGAHTLHRWRTS